MLFRLTFVLVGGLFLAMYFAPDLPENSRAARAQSELAARTAEAPPTDRPRAPDEMLDVVPVPPVAAPDPVPPDDRAASAGPARTADTQAEGASNDAGASDFGSLDPDGAPGAVAPIVIDGLSGGDAAAALSLSERIRARAEAERAETAAEDRADPAPPETRQAPAAPRLPGPGERRAQVVATAVNLRGGPSTGNPVVGRVDFGDELVYLGEAAPGWARIRHPETGEDAFMASRFLQTLSP